MNETHLLLLLVLKLVPFWRSRLAEIRVEQLMLHLAQWEQYLAKELVASEAIAMPDAQPEGSGIEFDQLNGTESELFIELRIQLALVHCRLAFAALAPVGQQVELHITVEVREFGQSVSGSVVR